MTDVTTVDLDAIEQDAATQARAAISLDVVDEYAEQIRSGVDLPPVDLYDDGKSLWLADGWHRVHAYRRAGAVQCDARIRKGSRRDAIAHACGANAEHGLPRSNQDKRRAVSLYLSEVYQHLDPPPSQEQIAKTCHVSQRFVSSIITEMVERGEVEARRQPGKRGRDTEPRERSSSSGEGDGARAPISGGPEREPPTKKKPPDQGTDAPPRETPTMRQARAWMAGLDAESAQAMRDRGEAVHRAVRQCLASLVKTGAVKVGAAESIDPKVWDAAVLVADEDGRANELAAFARLVMYAEGRLALLVQSAKDTGE